MRIFLCEYITGGGLHDQDLPRTLAQEGDLMLQALLDDLLEAGYDNLVCTRDSRLPQLSRPVECVNPAADAWSTWRELFENCEMAWIIAPERENVLLDLVRLADECGCRHPGCSQDKTALFTSKQKTTGWLAGRGMPAVPVYSSPRELPGNSEHGWIIKPDDGVGGEGVIHVPDTEALLNMWNGQQPGNLIIQPFIPGTPASMTVLCHDGRALLLACNEQCFTFREDGSGRLEAVVVNGCRQHYAPMKQVADQLAAEMVDETTCIGVDLVITGEGEIAIIEINPRLTTAYCGLRRSLGSNPAAMLLSVLRQGGLPGEDEFRFHPVRINL